MARPSDPREPADPPRPASTTALANISRRIVQLHKEFYGKGPTKAKTYYHDDLVIVLMRGGFTRVEETLLQSGRGDSVKQQRAAFQQAMREPFRQVIEEETGRKVIAFMSSSHQHPDMLSELFVLESAEVLTDDPEDEADLGRTGSVSLRQRAQDSRPPTVPVRTARRLRGPAHGSRRCPK